MLHLEQVSIEDTLLDLGGDSLTAITLSTKILSKFKEMNEISYRKENDKITVNFNNDYLKAFIFKSGTWLEIETNKLINFKADREITAGEIVDVKITSAKTWSLDGELL